ncbi:MAG TPA: c-type cytochrome domain-containing protein [Verrucomicrobiaceae bacterium]|jgi:mono/diheme cytochrome c family protein
MKTRRRSRPLLALLFILAPGLSCEKKSETGTKPVDFVTEIKPILQGRCIDCHHSGALFGEVNLENRAMALQSHKKGPAITPGDPQQSRLYIVLTLPDPSPKAMPPMAHRISNAEVELVKRWIQEGAKWPEGPDGTIKPSPAHEKGKV